MSLFTSKELSRFSTTKFLAEIANQPVPGVPEATLLTGLEREVSDTLASHVKKITGTTTTGALLPIACLKAFNVTTATAGGFLVGEDFLGGIVPALRSASVVLDLGSQLWENLRSDLGLPRESTTQTAQWLSETGELSAPRLHLRKDRSDAKTRGLHDDPLATATLAIERRHRVILPLFDSEKFGNGNRQSSLGWSRRRRAYWDPQFPWHEDQCDLRRHRVPFQACVDAAISRGRGRRQYAIGEFGLVTRLS